MNNKNEYKNYFPDDLPTTFSSYFSISLANKYVLQYLIILFYFLNLISCRKKERRNMYYLHSFSTQTEAYLALVKYDARKTQNFNYYL